ncbi:hypothetical protein [Vulcanisaeta thermophila]|uniref:hypothetical protein n=1 Tax=Vulcanisaeta thermophila TaxID=867917 RepID=UPI0008535AAA|nr:hypothetical protein [Vulcanisaeta thermophila]
MVALPRVERAMELLSHLLPGLALRFRDVGIPVPRELCVESLGRGTPGVIRELERISTTMARLWGWVPTFMRALLNLDPSININCYLDIEGVRASVNTAMELARLVLRTKLGGYVSDSEWLSAITTRRGKGIIDNAVVVVDDYVTYRELTSKFTVDVMALGPLVPTPVDLLYLVRVGELPRGRMGIVINYLVKYLGDYVVYSRDLTEAYGKLVSDLGYMGLIRELGLRVVV